MSLELMLIAPVELIGSNRYDHPVQKIPIWYAEGFADERDGRAFYENRVNCLFEAAYNYNSIERAWGNVWVDGPDDFSDHEKLDAFISYVNQAHPILKNFSNNFKKHYEHLPSDKPIWLLKSIKDIYSGTTIQMVTGDSRPDVVPIYLRALEFAFERASKSHALNAAEQSTWKVIGMEDLPELSELRKMPAVRATPHLFAGFLGGGLLEYTADHLTGSEDSLLGSFLFGGGVFMGLLSFFKAAYTHAFEKERKMYGEYMDASSHFRKSCVDDIMDIWVPEST